MSKVIAAVLAGSLAPVDEYLTPDDVERDYKIKKGTQASMRHHGTIPFFNLGKRIPRYRRSEIEAWIATRAAGAR